MMEDYRILPCGDAALAVMLGDTISERTGERVGALADALSAGNVTGITELIPAFCSLTVCYDSAAVSYPKLCRRIEKAMSRADGTTVSARRVHRIPVCYGGEFGPDLADVASLAGLSAEEVIRRHSAPDYRIYMLGFLPGFPYLGGLDESIAAPRLDSPRERIPRGSVGIGASQTGIYPMESPGGWRLIGRTPILPYDPARTPPVLYAAGDSIRFVPIDRARYDELAAAVAAGTYIHQVTEESI